MPSKIQTPRVLITGGLGHIGSKLIRVLQPGVTVVDNLMTQRYCSLFGPRIGYEPHIKFINKSFDDLDREFLAGFDTIIHLAAITDAASSFQNVKEIEDINVKMTKRFINTACDANVKLFIFPSSTSIYGTSVDIVHEEDLSAINPQSPYAESKIKIEQHLSKVGVSHVVLRFGTVYGVSPGMRFHTAVNKFCFQASIGEPLTVWHENRTQRRPYLHIDDAIRVFAWVVENKMDILNNTYNVLSGNHIVDEVLDIIAEFLPIKINEVDTPLLNQYSYEVSCDKILHAGFRTSGILRFGIWDTLRLLNRLNGMR